MARRTVLLVAAIMVAALGAALVTVYVHNVNKHALAKQQPVQVLIAKKLIPAGTTGAAAAADGALEKTTVPRDALATGGTVLDNITSVANRVTLAPIFPGEQILAEKFGKQGDSNALSIPTAGTIAVSIPFDDATRVDGFVVPGSDVAVFVTANNSTRLLLPRATVIAVGARTLVPSSGQSSNQAASSIVTFGVTDAEAQKLIYAESVGKLYLALLTKDSTVGNIPATSASNLFSP
jgi:pilus assembly protein CpaB